MSAYVREARDWGKLTSCQADCGHLELSIDKRLCGSQCGLYRERCGGWDDYWGTSRRLIHHVEHIAQEHRAIAVAGSQGQRGEDGRC